MADQYYIEQGYFTPDGYFVYTADASADITATATVAAQISVIKSAAAEITATATITALISNLVGADLFAFSDAQLSVSVDRLRSTEITASSVFDIATDYLRFRTATAEFSATATQTAAVTKSISADAGLESAFALICDNIRVRELVGPSRTAKTIQRFGDTVLSSTESKFGGTSAYFDNVGDSLRVDSHVDFNFGSGAWTIEFWMNHKDLSGFVDTLLDMRLSGSTAAQQRVVIRKAGNNTIVLLVNGINRITSTDVLSDSTWYHIAVTRTSGGLHQMFINGSQQLYSWTNTTSYQESPIRIGEASSDGLNYIGYIDDLRIIKGTALYTSSFTPPTQQLTDIPNTVLLLNMNVVTNTTTFFDTVENIVVPQPLLSISSQSTEIIKIGNLSAAITATASISATATTIVGTTKDLAVISALSATAAVTREYTSDFSLAASTAISGARTRTTSSLLSTESAIIADFNRTRGVDSLLITESTVTATAVKTGTLIADLSLDTELSVQESRTRNLESQLLSLFSPQVSAVLSADRGSDMQSTATMSVSANAQSTGRATLATQFSLSSTPGFLIDLDNNYNTGTRIIENKYSKLIYDPDDTPPAGIPLTPGWAMSFWYKKDLSTPEKGAFFSPEPNGTGNWICYDDRDLRYFKFDGSTTVYNWTWSSVLPDDLDWHHVLMIITGRSYQGTQLQQTMSVWIDGQRQSDVTRNYFPSVDTWGSDSFPRLWLGRAGTSVFEPDIGTQFRGGLAQVWMGPLATSSSNGFLPWTIRNSQFDSGLFYPYQDLGDDGRRSGSLPQPYIYDRLTEPWSQQEFFGGYLDSEKPATEPVEYPLMQAHADLTTGSITVSVLSANLTATATQSTKISYRIDVTKDLTAVSTLTAQAERLFGDILPQISAAATVQAIATRITPAQAQLAAESTLTAEPTSTLLVAALFASSGSLDCTVTKISPLSTEFSLETSLSAQALKIKRAVINIDSAMTATIAVTEITGPVGADLTAEFLVTCESIVFSKIAADLTTESTLLATANRRQPAEATITATATISLPDQDRIRNFDIDLEAFNTTVTVAKIIHIVLALTLPVRPETRLHQVDPETRLEGISRETRIKLIDPETRSLELEPESRQRELFGG